MARVAAGSDSSFNKTEMILSPFCAISRTFIFALWRELKKIDAIPLTLEILSPIEVTIP